MNQTGNKSCFIIKILKSIRSRVNEQLLSVILHESETVEDHNPKMLSKWVYSINI